MSIFILILHIITIVIFYYRAFAYDVLSKTSRHGIIIATALTIALIPHLGYNVTSHEISSRELDVEIYESPTHKSLFYDGNVYTFTKASEVNRNMKAMLIIMRNGFGSMSYRIKLVPIDEVE
jgi:hypothetical protein